MKLDVLLGPHPEDYGMQEKRERMRDVTPNPFVKSGEPEAYAASLELDFNKQLAKQPARFRIVIEQLANLPKLIRNCKNPFS